MKKRISSILIVAASCAAILTGCSNADSGTKSTPETTPETTSAITSAESTAAEANTNETNPPETTSSNLSDVTGMESETTQSTPQALMPLAELEENNGTIAVILPQEECVCKTVYEFDESGVFSGAKAWIMPADGKSLEDVYEISGVSIAIEEFTLVGDHYEAVCPSDIALPEGTGTSYDEVRSYAKETIDKYNAFLSMFSGLMTDENSPGESTVESTENNAGYSFELGDYDVTAYVDTASYSNPCLCVNVSATVNGDADMDDIKSPNVTISGAVAGEDMKTLDINTSGRAKVNELMTWTYSHDMTDTESKYDLISVAIDDNSETMKWEDLIAEE